MGRVKRQTQKTNQMQNPEKALPQALRLSKIQLSVLLKCHAPRIRSVDLRVHCATIWWSRVHTRPTPWPCKPTTRWPGLLSSTCTFLSAHCVGHRAVYSNERRFIVRRRLSVQTDWLYPNASFSLRTTTRTLLKRLLVSHRTWRSLVGSRLAPDWRFSCSTQNWKTPLLELVRTPTTRWQRGVCTFLHSR